MSQQSALAYFYDFYREAPTSTFALPNNIPKQYFTLLKSYGQKNPTWRDLVRNGKNASSGYMRDVVIIDGEQPSLRFSYKRKAISWLPTVPTTTYYYPTLGIHSGTHPIWMRPEDHPDYTSCVNQALGKVKSKMNDLSPEMNLLVPIGEAKESAMLIKQIRDLIFDIFKILKSIKRFDVEGAAKATSDCWLIYNFGIKPLLMDLDRIGQVITQRITFDHPFRIGGLSKVRTYKRSISYDDTTYTCAPGSNWRQRGQIEYDLSVRVKTLFRFRVESEQEYSLLRAFMLDSDHIFGSLVSAAWELLPFSWAADYFGNLGEFLDQAFFIPPGQSVYVNQMTKMDVRYDLTWELREGNYGIHEKDPDRYKYGTSKNCKIRRSFFRRDALDALPYAGLTWKTGDQIKKNADTKIANLAAVLTQRRVNAMRDTRRRDERAVDILLHRNRNPGSYRR